MNEKDTISIEGCTNAKEVYKKTHERIVELTEAYCETYGIEPAYVKLPLGVYNILRHYYKELLSVWDTSEAETFCGLRLCPTTQIQYIGEMEVF